MEDSELIFSQINHFKENLISNIQGGVIICQFDPITGDCKTVYLSEGWTALTGYTIDEFKETFGSNPRSLIYPKDIPRCNMEYLEQMKTGNSYQLEYRFLHKNGSLFWVIDKGIVSHPQEDIHLNQSVITNIDLIKDNEEKLRLSEARFRIAINAAHATVFDFDIAEMRYLYLENAAVVFRADAKAIISSFDAFRARTPNFQIEDVFNHWFHADDVQMLLHIYEETLKGTVGESEVRVRQPDGSYIWCRLNCAAVEDDEGHPIRVVGHLVDIEEQHQRTERLLLEAQSDALTGLYNKTAIKDFVEVALNKTPQLAHVLFMLDIDNFKGVNDQLGHLFGDAVLMDVSTKLKRLFRRDGIVGRIGGDEFVILLKSHCTVEESAKRAEVICRAFRHTYAGEKTDYKISCSVGIAFSVAGDNYDTLFHRADLALYRAKSLGKDRYVVYSPEQYKNVPMGTSRINQNDNADSGNLKIKERIFELLYDSVDFSGSVNMILALLGQLLEASHIYIFKNTTDNKFADSIYEWCGESIPAETRLPIANYYEQFSSDGIFRCRDFSKLPKQFQSLYEENAACDTFQIAIMEENTVQGFMRYDSANHFSAEQLEIMTFAAKATCTFIIKKQADESVRQFNQNKMEALDKMSSAIYVIDEQYKLHYVNNMVLTIHPTVQLGQKCYEVFMANESPCPGCPAIDCTNGTCSTEMYNPVFKMWFISNASTIRWSGCDNMRLLCCQIINQYKNGSDV